MLKIDKLSMSDDLYTHFVSQGFLRQSVIDQLKGKHTLHPDLPDSDLLAATIRRNGKVFIYTGTLKKYS